MLAIPTVDRHASAPYRRALPEADVLMMSLSTRRRECSSLCDLSATGDARLRTRRAVVSPGLGVRKGMLTSLR